MRRFSIAFIALITVLVPFVSAVAQESGPQAMPVEPIKNFEIVPKGEWITHTFEIKNEGTAALELLDVKPSCGCTVAEFDKKVAPGKIGKVQVKLDTTNLTGPVSKPIAVFTNDPGNPKIQLVVKADVKPYLGIHPGYARFIYVQGEDLQPITQLVWAEDGTDLDVVDVKVPYDYVRVDKRVANEDERSHDFPGKQWIFDVHLNPDAPVGSLREYVEVTVNHPKQKVINIPLSGFVRPRQHVTPQKIDFGVLDGESLPHQRVVTFTSFITSAVEVTKTESGVEGLTVVVNEVGRKDGHRFELLITMGPDVKKGEFESTLKLYITDEQNPIVEVPISGSIL